jgi:hypothetical protein
MNYNPAEMGPQNYKNRQLFKSLAHYYGVSFCLNPMTNIYRRKKRIKSPRIICLSSMNSNKHLIYCEMDSLKNPKKKIEHYE